MKIAISMVVAILLLIVGFIGCGNYGVKNTTQMDLVNSQKEMIQKNRDIIAAITMI